MTRSTVLAGALQAGDVLDKPIDDLPSLLEGITSTKAGVAALDALHAQLADAEREAAVHAVAAEAAQLRGEEAEQQHAAKAGVLDRCAARIRLAINRATERLAEVAEQERRAAGEASADRARKAAVQLEKLIEKYIAAAGTVAALIGEIEAATASLIRDRSQAREAGVQCDAQLPHESRFIPELTEDRTVIDRTTGATVTDATGRSLDGKPIQYLETRRIERVVVQQRRAPRSILEVLAVLPDPDGGNIVDRRG